MPDGGPRENGVNPHVVAAVCISLAAFGLALAAFSVALVALLHCT
jgi:hypothetical protein